MGAFVLRNGADSALRDGDALRASTINSVSATFLARTQLTAIGGRVLVTSATFLARTSLTPAAWVSTRTIPELQVLVGFEADPFDSLASVVWTDVTADALAIHTSRGRQHELSRVEPSTLDLTLNNRLRRYDPTNTASPYSPNVDVLRRVQVRAKVAGQWCYRFTGYITEWALRWPHQTAAEVDVAAVDLLGILNLFPLSDTGYAAEVMADNPTAYWRLGDERDSSGSANHGTLVGGDAVITEPLLPESGGALDATKGYLLVDSIPTLEGTGAWSFDFIAQGTDIPDGFGFSVDKSFEELLAELNTFGVLFDGPEADSPYVYYAPYYQQFYVVVPGAVSFSSGLAFRRLADGEPHHFAVTRSANGGTYRLYCDGVLLESSTSTSHSVRTATPAYIGTSRSQSSDGPNLKGIVDEFAVYGSELSATRVAAHSALATNVWADDTSGARIGRLIDLVGVAAADRVLDTGTIVVRTLTDAVVDDALPHMQKVEEAEDGRLFMAGDGKVTFHGRHRRLVTHTTSLVTFGDGMGQTPYLPGPEPVLDEQDLYSEVEVTPEGLMAQVSSDAATQTRYGKRTLSRSGTLHRNTNDGKAMADWLFDQYKTPKVRIRSLTFQPSANPTSYETLLARELGDRVTVERAIIPGGGPTFSQPSHIERIEESIDAEAMTWELGFALSVADEVQAWGTLGTSTLGGTLRLAY